MHKSILAGNALPDGAALSYIIRGQVKLEGCKKDGAIVCSCCNKLVSPSQFEKHAGCGSHKKPYHNIFTSNGMSLHQLYVDQVQSSESCSREKDDLCSICKLRGNLMSCGNCPRSFHYECAAPSGIPQGKWYCRYCENLFGKKKFSKRNKNAIAAGRVAGANPVEEINQRCIRIVGSLEVEIGGCCICGGHGFSKSRITDNTIIICDQCDREYHVGCLKERKIADLEVLPEDDWFCCIECNTMNSTLKELMEAGEQMLPPNLENHIKKKFEEHGSQQNSELDKIRWRLFKGKQASEVTRVWLSGAVNIFHECFDPISVPSNSGLDLIPNMVYGREVNGQDFCGMYCAILTANSVAVSAGIIRIFGAEVAELPLVATRPDYQGKGYFQYLLFCIENLLSHLNVKELVLPAAHEAESMWKNKFGFENLGQEQLDQYMRSYPMMAFNGTSFLHKPISGS
ncbi:increased DNA methylation 1-like [Primulina huaijiensis]|uniref:increased DNA methylation 1-like n=1 Tax=Primulina huaijiensis TaxID=1492673 RepID=UPI003CC705DA